VIVFRVPCRTLYRRVWENKKARNLAHKSAQNLRHTVEKELVRWITCLTIIGYPPRYPTLKEMTEEVRKRRVKEINNDGIEYPKIGKEWVQQFLRRHPELAGVTPQSIDATRVKDMSYEHLQQWFHDLEEVIAEYNIKSENIYNMDETGFAIEEKQSGRCIINAQIHERFQAKPGRQEWVSVVEYVCAD